MRRRRASRVMRVGNGSPVGTSVASVTPAGLLPAFHAITDATRTARRSPLPSRGVEFSVLGPLEVRAGSDVVSIRHGMPRALLIALLLRPGQTVSASFLIDGLWGEELPRNPA